MNSFHWQLIWKDGKQLQNKSNSDHVLNTYLMNIDLILLYDLFFIGYFLRSQALFDHEEMFIIHRVFSRIYCSLVVITFCV